MSFSARQKIRARPASLLRALVAPNLLVEGLVKGWVDENFPEGDRPSATVWILDNRQELLENSVEELVKLRERWDQRDQSAEAAIERLNLLFDKCRDGKNC